MTVRSEREEATAGLRDASTPGRGQKLYEKARTLIPGGTQLLSKRPEMYLPDQWPAYFSRAKGAEVWDLDGRRYIDMSNCGVGACILGYSDPDVNAAVRKAVDDGCASTLNCPEEVELAELLLSLHPWAASVRYSRTGGEAMAVAVRIARAATGRDKVAFCGYHGWHDWYLAANLSPDDKLGGHLLPGLAPAGVPRGLGGTMLPFHYNRVDELEAIVTAHGHDLAAIVMEPLRHQEPAEGFLARVKQLASETGAVLVFDEITIGWRLVVGGVHLRLGVQPDVAVFAKGMSNGHPMSAVIGVDSVMAAAQASFISSTYWTERVGPTAALATIRKMQRENVPARLNEAGLRVQEVWRAAAQKHGLKLHIEGPPPLSAFSFEASDVTAVRTLFTQIMLDRGFLATGAFYAMAAHANEQIDEYGDAVDGAFEQIALAMKQGTVRSELRGPPAHGGFQRLT